MRKLAKKREESLETISSPVSQTICAAVVWAKYPRAPFTGDTTEPPLKSKQQRLESLRWMPLLVLLLSLLALSIVLLTTMDTIDTAALSCFVSHERIVS